MYVKKVLKFLYFHNPEHSNGEDRCLIFIKEMNNSSAKSELTKAQVKYTAFGRTYAFDLKQPSCKPPTILQNVEMMLICEGKTGTSYIR